MNKFAENFNLTLDITVDESHCNDVINTWDSGANEKATRQLLFTTSEEYLQCQEDFGMFACFESCCKSIVIKKKPVKDFTAC